MGFFLFCTSLMICAILYEKFSVKKFKSAFLLNLKSKHISVVRHGGMLNYYYEVSINNKPCSRFVPNLLADPTIELLNSNSQFSILKHYDKQNTLYSFKEYSSQILQTISNVKLECTTKAMYFAYPKNTDSILFYDNQKNIVGGFTIDFDIVKFQDQFEEDELVFLILMGILTLSKYNSLRD